jgi:hypothetical protein
MVHGLEKIFELNEVAEEKARDEAFDLAHEIVTEILANHVVSVVLEDETIEHTLISDVSELIPAVEAILLRQ